jgi:hypothetical protein
MEESFNYNNNVTSDRGRRALIIIIMSLKLSSLCQM